MIGWEKRKGIQHEPLSPWTLTSGPGPSSWWCEDEIRLGSTGTRWRTLSTVHCTSCKLELPQVLPPFNMAPLPLNFPFPLLCQGTSALTDCHPASESSKMPSKIQSHYASLPLPLEYQSCFSQHQSFPPGHRLGSAPDTAAAASSWQETALSSLLSLGVSLFLMVAWLPRPLLLYLLQVQFTVHKAPSLLLPQCDMDCYSLGWGQGLFLTFWNLATSTLLDLLSDLKFLKKKTQEK